MMMVAVLAALSFSQVPAPAETGRLSGRVTTEGTNAPIVGARVMVFPMIGPSTLRTRLMLPPAPGLTDQDGRFAFSGLAPGEYLVNVQKTGFAPASPDPTTRPTTYTLTAGQALDNISIVLQKGAVISGKLLDQKGEPVTDARVMAMRRISPPGGSAIPPRLIPAPMQGPQQTNDLGEFRVIGLAPGEYYVAAMPRAMMLGGPGSTQTTGSGGGTPTATTTFYPGTTDQAGAHAVTVSAGAEVANIVFALQTAAAFRVSGIVVDENGAPVAGAMVMLMNDPRNGMTFPGPGVNARTSDDGRFSIGDVTAGTYRLNASVPMIVRSGGGGPITGGIVGGIVSGSGSFSTWSSGSVSGGGVTTNYAGGPEPAEVVVNGADVTGVRVVARRPPAQ